MELVIYHKLDRPLELPIAYNYVLQGIIYNSLKQNHQLSNFLHNEGYEHIEKSFKMFVFSNIKGKYRIKDKKITFFHEISFSVRSVYPLILLILKDKFSEGINYNGNVYNGVQCELIDNTIEFEDIYIEMLTPMCLYITENNKTKYFSPFEEEFYYLLNDNFYRKYFAYYGVYPESPLYLEPVSVEKKDKVVTTFKGTYITGYKGKYIIRGERKYLDFVYQVGLGSKNSQGFGMFGFVEE